MIRLSLFASLLLAPACLAQGPAAESEDVLRFVNGDQLRGQFLGLGENGRITWSRADVKEPMDFQRDKVRQIVLRGGHPEHFTRGANHLALVNGDRLPGRLISMDESKVSFATDNAGTIELQRDAVSMIAPNPFGGRLVYTGPFDESSWKVVSATLPPAGNPSGDGADAKAREPGWKHQGASWYSKPGNDGLQLLEDTPDKMLLRFKIGSRGTPGIAVAFDADFIHPPAADDPKASANANTTFSRLFGNAYVMSISGFTQLYRCGFDKDGLPIPPERLRAANSSFGAKNGGDTLIEIRRDRKAQTVSLYADGEFVLQWDTKPEDGTESAPPTGKKVGFQVTGSSNPLRLSDMIIAEWNGMTDSARSMESASNDIVLLTNGTDRFSGHVTGIQNGKLAFDGKYSGLSIPLEDIAEIHLARDGRRELKETQASSITVHYQPIGRITGTPILAADGRLKLNSILAGELDLDLSAAVVLEFQSAGGFLDNWDDDF